MSGLPRADDPDASLAEAIRRDGPVIVPFTLDLLPSAVTNGPPASLPADLARAPYNRLRGHGADNLPDAAGLHLPVEALAKNGLLAHVTTMPDGTGGYRFDYPVLRYAEVYLPSLSLEAVRVFLGIAKNQVIVELGQGINLGPLQVPTDRGMRLLVNYYPSGSFERVQFRRCPVRPGRAADLCRQDRPNWSERPRIGRHHCHPLSAGNVRSSSVMRP